MMGQPVVVKGQPVPTSEEGKWSTPLFSCTGVRTCLLTHAVKSARIPRSRTPRLDVQPMSLTRRSPYPHLQDWCSCCAVMCCMPVTTAQLYTRFFGSTTCPAVPPTLLCVCIALFLFVGLSANAQATAPPPEGAATGQIVYSSDGEPIVLGTMEQPVSPVLGMIGAAASCMSCLIVCNVRRFIRKRDGIQEEHCGGCEDIACAACCGPCTQCLIMRHEALVFGKYSLVSPIGTPIAV